MSSTRRGKKYVKRYILIGYDDRGDQIARVDGLSFNEVEQRKKDYLHYNIIESITATQKKTCDVSDCDQVAVAMMVISEGQREMVEHPKLRAVPLCRYHSSAVRLIFEPSVKDRVSYKGVISAPNYLCIKYCPSFWKGRCEAFGEPVNRAHAKKKFKGFRGMAILCMQDEWWRRW